MSGGFRLPDQTERAFVFGRTGTGKTVFLVWLLSMASIEERPWIIIDTKQDRYLRSLPRVQKIKMGEIPRYPGVYIANADLENQEEIQQYLRDILDKGNVGVFSDEGADIAQREPRYTALKAIFAKGRSKRVPILFATQRPSWINRSVMSESDYFACFHLQHSDDVKTAEKFMPVELTRLDKFWSHWYDVKQNAYFRLSPVDEAKVFQTLDDRLKPKQRLI